MDEEFRDLAELEAQTEELKEFYRRLGVDEKGIDTFFLEIIRTDDTKKVANLSNEELGMPQIPVRAQLELAKDCDKIPSMSSWAKDLRENAEIILATSLSKEGFLIKARITQKKEFLDKEKRRVRKGLFGKKEEVQEV